jgi:glucuronate isomerase
MKQFLNDNFILETAVANKLYYSHAEKMPIVDYHCHLSLKQIAENKNFKNQAAIWWFLNQKSRMENQMNALSNLGLLSRFVGMLTDSRSFMPYSRHEYFRRILCNLLGNDVEKWQIPYDLKLLGAMVEDICYNHAKC